MNSKNIQDVILSTYLLQVDHGIDNLDYPLNEDLFEGYRKWIARAINKNRGATFDEIVHFLQRNNAMREMEFLTILGKPQPTDTGYCTLSRDILNRYTKLLEADKAAEMAGI